MLVKWNNITFLETSFCIKLKVIVIKSSFFKIGYYDKLNQGLKYRNKKWTSINNKSYKFIILIQRYLIHK